PGCRLPIEGETPPPTRGAGRRRWKVLPVRPGRAPGRSLMAARDLLARSCPRSCPHRRNLDLCLLQTPPAAVLIGSNRQAVRFLGRSGAADLQIVRHAQPLPQRLQIVADRIGYELGARLVE